MRVLAFDAATKTGWASFASARSVPVLGTIDLPVGPAYGLRNLALFNAARGLIKVHRPDLVAVERPFFLPRDTWHERRLLVGVVCSIEMAAEACDVRCVDVGANDAKAALTGNRRAKKPEMVDAAKAMGWPVGDHHQADTCGIALVVYGNVTRGLEVAT